MRDGERARWRGRRRFGEDARRRRESGGIDECVMCDEIGCVCDDIGFGCGYGVFCGV